MKPRDADWGDGDTTASVIDIEVGHIGMLMSYGYPLDLVPPGRSQIVKKEGTLIAVQQDVHSVTVLDGGGLR